MRLTNRVIRTGPEISSINDDIGCMRGCAFVLGIIAVIVVIVVIIEIGNKCNWW